jgi:type I restriction enzyme M protein
VSFSDSGHDSKGAAFEYFVRATLKGKKLGQYFTPRPLVKVMAHLVGREKIVNHLMGGDTPKVLDPACGTGGFLVYLMQDGLDIIDEKLQSRAINQSTHAKLAGTLIKKTFFGSDANTGVAGAAKMNMIIAGDGHTNIRDEDSLTISATNWSSKEMTCDFIFTNPPFGTSESESLEEPDLAEYPVRSTKGQHLFLQKMILSTKVGGEICSVIDEGVLNTESARELRKWILQQCRILAIVRLPEETFKPNKINVKSSVLYMQKLDNPDLDGELEYKVTFVDLRSLGYEGSGEAIRNFDLSELLSDAQNEWLNHEKGVRRDSIHWRAFDISRRRYALTRRHGLI